MNISKLTPAPWTWEGRYFAGMVLGGRPNGEVIGKIDPNRNGNGKDADGEFIALARNAFDVMMRREWQAEKNQYGWRAKDIDGVWCEVYELGYSDPFTALVEADKWYRQNVEGT